MAIRVPFEILPSDDTSGILGQKPAACGNNLHHCVGFGDEQIPSIPNAAEHCTPVTSVLRIPTINNEAEASYLFHLSSLHRSEGIDFELLPFLTVVFYGMNPELTILIFLNCWVKKDDQSHKALEIL